MRNGWLRAAASVGLVALIATSAGGAAKAARPARDAEPTMRVAPDTALWDRQRVGVRVDGLEPFAFGTVAQCVGADRLRCAPATTFVDADETGSARTFVVVRRMLSVRNGRTFDCAQRKCSIRVGSNPGLRARIRFDHNGPHTRSDLQAQPECVAWPTSGWPTGPLPEGVDPAVVARIGEEMVGPDAADSMVVIHGGRLVYERYAPGFDADSIQPSFSMSKSFTSTVIGLLAQDGALDIDARAPIAAWAGAGDPRRAITLRHILNMSSGLEWEENYSDVESDIFRMFRSDDEADYVIAKPLVFTPGSRFRYSTGDTAILGHIIGETAGVSGPTYEQFLHDRLFDPLGINPVEPSFDVSGDWTAGWRTNTTTRNFAKLGLLYLRNGTWEDQPFLSPDWVDFVRTPSPAYSGYGGQFWLDGDTFSMVGFGGQMVRIVPALDLIVAVNNGGGASSMVDAFSGAVRPACEGDPVLADDTADAGHHGAVRVPVLANDARNEVGLAPRTLTVSNPPAHGTAVVVGRTIRYVPEPGFTGTDGFDYVVCARDRSRCPEAHVTVATG